LKREQDMARELEGDAASVEATTARAPGDAPAAAPFDLASLPSIESIVADSNIGAFLQSGVPAELTRAALRRAWESDPAIRDFIGIAENQWDFNDPSAIPGFGPLQADNGSTLLARAIGTSNDGPRTILEISPAVGQTPSATTDEEPAPVDRSVRETPDKLPSADAGISGSSKADNNADVVTERVRSVEGSEPSPNRRHHGSALPR
jgi:hypothetical protein